MVNSSSASPTGGAALSSKSESAFAKHKAIQQNDETPSNTGTKMPLTARLLIFIVIPTFTGVAGLGISYLQSLRLFEGEKHAVNFDTDFVTPFLLALAFVIVIGFQTNGFTGEKRRGAFVWPTTRKVQKVRRERVIVDDNIDDKKEQ